MEKYHKWILNLLMIVDPASIEAVDKSLEGNLTTSDVRLWFSGNDFSSEGVGDKSLINKYVESKGYKSERYESNPHESKMQSNLNKGQNVRALFVMGGDEGHLVVYKSTIKTTYYNKLGVRTGTSYSYKVMNPSRNSIISSNSVTKTHFIYPNK